MIIFEVLRYQNFLSSGNQFTEIPLNKYTNTLIIGKNGAGKSTVLDAICFALFNEPFRNINKPQLVNTINRKNLLVEIEFSIGLTKYLIRRGIKPAVFEIYKDGDMINQSAETKDYQKILERQILKLNIKSFRQIVILGSASFVPFMSLTPAARRAIIEDLLELEIFTSMNNLLKERKGQNIKDIGEINSRISLVKEKIDMYNKHMVQVQANTEEIIKDKLEIVEKTTQELYAIKSKTEAYDQGIALIYKQLDGRDDKTKAIAKIERSLYRLYVDKQNLEKELLFLQEHETCPTCTQDIEKAFRDKTIDKKKKDIAKYEKVITKALHEQESNELHQVGIDADKVNIARLQQEQSQLFAEAKVKAFYIAGIQQDIEKINQQHDYNGARIDELTDELKEEELELQEATEDKAVLDAATLMLKDTGIKAKMIKQFVPVINKLITGFLANLDFAVSFELDEKFEESIKSRFRDDFTYDSFSEGEKKRINLAIIFTWRAIAKIRNSANTNLFILDEVFDSSLDITGTEDVLRLLLSLSAENTFIISHNAAASGDKFENVIKFEKNNSFSRIVEA